MKFRYLAISALLAGSLAFAAACGGGGATQGGGQATPQAPGAGGQAATSAAGQVRVPEPANKADLARLRGDIIADGSSTVYPVTAAAAEEFRKYARDVRASVGIAGTGGGFKKFCNGETDISNASRPISRSEQEACRQAGIEFIELPVAFDGLSVVVSPRNNFVTCLTVAELKKMWEPQAQGQISNWNQIRGSFPNQPLKLFGAGTDSGTFDYFTEAVVGTAKSSRGDYQASEDDNVLVQGVSNDPAALGYFGFAYYIENPGKLKAVGIDAKGDGKCVEPSLETIKDGTYQPLSRPLFIYVTKKAAARPEVQAFVNFMLSKSFTPLLPTREIGYVPLQDNIYEAVQKRFAAGTTGTLFPNGQEVGATLDRYLR
jgi:phosphate transport system substrate-binding protein